MTYVSNDTKNIEDQALSVNENAFPQKEELQKQAAKENLQNKLSLAEAGYPVELDPNEAERAEELGWEACSFAEAVAEGYDPEGDNFSQEEIEEAVKNGDYTEILSGLLSKAIEILKAQSKENNGGKTAYIDLTEAEKKRFHSLNFAMEEIKFLQNQARKNTREQNLALILKWQPLLSQEEQKDALAEELNLLAEKGRRRDAIEASRASFELEGHYASDTDKALSERFINLEITMEEYEELINKKVEEHGRKD
ncbi:hypothetical protein FAI40_08265 [Acetobacteraceae bacterium]|nr:hypothetical protein FAI40_08265 [Acetobacteraceae bacterium]